MGKQEQYAAIQRDQYNQTSDTLERARAEVAPNYDLLRDVAPNYARFVLQNYLTRRSLKLPFSPQEVDIVRDLHVLDFGCGVGRVMEGFVEAGVARVDGADISEEMLKHARASELLKTSRFFLASGTDAGDPPSNYYDVATAFLVLHHIPMRQTRIDILRSIAESLKDDGMVFIELKIFPGVTPARIPPNHAHWSENMVAKGTNSLADVWVTPDSLGMVYEDLRLFFSDVAMFEADARVDYFTFQPDQIYQYGFNPIYFAASKSPQLLDLLNAPVAPD